MMQLIYIQFIQTPFQILTTLDKMNTEFNDQSAEVIPYSK